MFYIWNDKYKFILVTTETSMENSNLRHDLWSAKAKITNLIIYFFQIPQTVLRREDSWSITNCIEKKIALME